MTQQLAIDQADAAATVAAVPHPAALQEITIYSCAHRVMATTCSD